MANTVLIRRSATPSAVPTTGQLALGELALNTYDGKLYMKKNVSGTESIVQIGAGGGSSVTVSTTAPSSPAAGDLWFDSTNGKLKIYYNDGTSSQWVDAFVGTIGATGASGTIDGTTVTAFNGVLKGTGTGIAVATAGTDYLAPPSGTALLKANSGGALANAVAGTDYMAPSGGTFSGDVGIGIATDGSQFLHLGAGTATKAPLEFNAGTNMTTVDAGSMEYDGTCLYMTPFGNSRSVVNEEQLVVLGTAYTLTSQTAAQKMFNATTNGAVTLAVGTYQFECAFSLTAMSATSGSFGFALGVGTAVIGSQGWEAKAVKAALATATAPQISYNTAANATLATANTTTTGHAFIKGFFRVTTAGTVIPQVSLGVAAAAVVGAQSYFKCSPVSPTNVAATNITVGNWS